LLLFRGLVLPTITRQRHLLGEPQRQRWDDRRTTT